MQDPDNMPKKTKINPKDNYTIEGQKTKQTSDRDKYRKQYLGIILANWTG